MKLPTVILAFVTIYEISYVTGNSTGRSVQIAIQEAGALRIDRNALKDLLQKPEIQNKPLAVISIAGAKRTGKSFLMNFFLRCLRNKGNPAWLGGPNKEIDEGFQWAAGHKPNTTGINIWEEYLTVKRKNGEEVVVLLMDTQGLYDHDVTKETNVKLFTISTIASSVQILNIMNMIEERDLENLHLSVEFAIAASSVEKKAVQLQNLMMLVRNWPHKQFHPYGLKGGHEYLNEVLEEKNGLAGNNNVRKYLRSTLNELECYLMPHPGLIVTQGDFQGTNKEILVDSLLHTEKLVEHLLSPETINVKKWNGNPMTARELLTLILKCDDAFESGQLPNVENMLEANMNAHYSIANDRSVRKYQECMKDTCTGDTLVSSEDLEKRDKRCTNESINGYDLAIKIGPDKVKSRFRESLVKEIEKERQICRGNFERKMIEIEQVIKNERENLFLEYRETMDKLVQQSALSESELLAYHLENFLSAFSEFESKMRKFRDVLNLNDVYMHFKKPFNEYYDLLSKINHMRIEIEKGAEDNEELRKELERLKNKKTTFFEDFFRLIDTLAREVGRLINNFRIR